MYIQNSLVPNGLRNAGYKHPKSPSVAWLTSFESPDDVKNKLEGLFNTGVIVTLGSYMVEAVTWKVDKSIKIYIACTSGKTPAQSIKLLKDYGFEPIPDLDQSVNWLHQGTTKCTMYRKNVK